MSNIWVAELPIGEEGEIVEEFLSRDFDPLKLWEDHGWNGSTIFIYDKTDRMRPVAKIAEKYDQFSSTWKPWVQPLDEKGKKIAFEWH